MIKVMKKKNIGNALHVTLWSRTATNVIVFIVQNVMSSMFCITILVFKTVLINMKSYKKEFAKR